MGKTPEAKVRDPVVRWAKVSGVLHIRQSFLPGARSGWPDDMFIHKGKIGFIEFKAPGRKPTELQTIRAAELVSQGMPVTWADDKEKAIQWLQMVLDL